jgi:hypothetical protein
MPLAAIIALAAVAAIALAVAAVYALGFELGGRALRASAAEAADRTSDLAAEFFEWLRTGR